MEEACFQAAGAAKHRQIVLARLGVKNGNPLQYSPLDNPGDKGDWRATIHRVARDSDTTE